MRLHVPDTKFIVTQQTDDHGVSSIHIGDIDTGPVCELLVTTGEHVKVSRDPFVHQHIPGFGADELMSDPAQASQAPPPAEQTIPPSYDGLGRFRKKPVVIEAIQFDGTANGAKRIQAAFPDHKIEAEVKSIGCLWPEPGWSPPAKLYIPTLEGGMTAGKGDWIIRGVKGEVYPCKPDIFAATYEAVT